MFLFTNVSHGSHNFLINEKVIHPKPLCNMQLLLPVYIYDFCIFFKLGAGGEAWQIEQAKQH